MHARRSFASGLVLLFALLWVATGCGGGGSSSTSSSSGNTSGGGSSSSSSTPQNVLTITVNAGPDNNYADGAFASVTVCVPGSSTCQTIDGVLVDTGSYGLRLLSSALTVPLTTTKDANGNPIGECNQFEDGYTWGPVATADIQLAGEKASAVPIQIIGQSGFTAAPSACTSTGGTAENDVSSLGANGVLGIGLFRQDCGQECVGSTDPNEYFSCPSSGCIGTTMALAQQVQNPVWLFPTDNNGTLIQFPTVPATGAATQTGSLIFGIGTQSNNGLGGANVLTTDGAGNITTTYNGTAYSTSYIDSGSNGYYFPSNGTQGLTTCSGGNKDFYCPASTLNLSATMQGANAKTAQVNFSVANADALFNSNNTAFNDLAGPDTTSSSTTPSSTNTGPSFDWGMPFFFGRSVFTGIELQSSPGGVGPYFAF